MKINRNSFIENKTYNISDDIDFSNEDFSSSQQIKSINSCHVEATINDYKDLLRIKVHIKAEVIGICSYSLEDVPLTINAEDEIEISDNKDDADQFFIEESPSFLLDSYILGIIISELPTRIIKKGKTLPPSGNGYRVMSEDDYKKEKEKQTDSRWDALDKFMK